MRIQRVQQNAAKDSGRRASRALVGRHEYVTRIPLLGLSTSSPSSSSESSESAAALRAVRAAPPVRPLCGVPLLLAGGVSAALNPPLRSGAAEANEKVLPPLPNEGAGAFAKPPPLLAATPANPPPPLAARPANPPPAEEPPKAVPPVLPKAVPTQKHNVG